MTTTVGTTFFEGASGALTYPAGVGAGDFAFLHIQSRTQTPTGFTRLPNSERVWYRILTATGNPAPSLSGPWRLVVFRHSAGCLLGTVGARRTFASGSHTITETLATTSAGRLVWAIDGTVVSFNSSPATMTLRQASSVDNNYSIASLDEQVNAGQHTRTASVNLNLGGYSQAFYIVPANEPPLAPTPLYPLTSSEPFDRNVTNRFSWRPNDPNAGDSQSRAEIRYRQRTASAPWVTVNLVTPNAYWDAAAGTFAAADYEWQVRTYDALGEVGPFSSSEFFTAASAPTDLTVTSPTNGQTIPVSTHQVTWSTALAQQSWQMRQVGDNNGAPDTATVYFDTGEVVAAGTRSVLASFNVNQRWEHVQVRIKVGGLWSAWVSRRVYVQYTPPLAPTVSVLVDDVTATMVVTANHPQVYGSIPRVASQQLWSRGADGFRNNGIPITDFYAPNMAHWDQAVASDVDYAYRFRVRAGNGVEAWSEWSDVDSTESAPVNTVRPSISGSPVVGNLLTYQRGTWAGVPTPTVTHAWRVAGTTVGTGGTLTVQSGWVGATITIVETATAGLSDGPVTVTAESVPTAPVTAAPLTPAPANVTLPGTSTTPQEGVAYTATAGTWENADTIERMWRWTT